MTGDERTYSTEEAAMLAGVSYRRLDYWLRQGHITIGQDAEGSGSQRRFTSEEVDRLLLYVTAVSHARDVLEAARSGELWDSLNTPERIDA